MSLLSVNNLSHAHGTQQVLSGVTFSIEPNEKVGLVGRNGTGKTTLLRSIAGLLNYDEGTVQYARNRRIGYLAQDPEFDPGLTTYEAAESAYAGLVIAHRKLNEVAEKMSKTDNDSDELHRLMKRYDRLEHEIERLGGYHIQHKIEGTLLGLGFTKDKFTQSVVGLSGGECSRLALAKLLLEDPDLLLLDEPTNHLDIAGRLWLEKFLIEEFRGSVIVISHDRYLLDNVVNRILELEPGGKMYSYPGNYDKFRDLRLERKVVEQRIHEKQLDRVRAEEKFIARYKSGQRAKQARGRESRLDRFREGMMERPMELDVMKLNLPKGKRSGDIVITSDRLSKSYGDNTLFADVSLAVLRGERVGVIGPNGTGKSTLIKCLIGELEPSTGISKLGANVSVGYFRQTHEGIDMDLTVWQYIQSIILTLESGARASEQQARDLAGAFLFSGDDQDKLMGLISGGERSRARLAGLVCGGHNLLVLDEPTNHFDIPSCERLEQALDPVTGFDGTLILISHDRALLDACVEKLIIFDGKGGVRIFHGNYSDWAEKEKQLNKEGLGQQQSQSEKNTTESSSATVNNQAQTNKQKYNKGNSGNRGIGGGGAITKLNFNKLEAIIEKIEKRISEIDDSMLEVAVQRDGMFLKSLSEERMKLQEELEPYENEWVRRAEEEG